MMDNFNFLPLKKLGFVFLTFYQLLVCEHVCKRSVLLEKKEMPISSGYKNTLKRMRMREPAYVPVRVVQLCPPHPGRLTVVAVRGRRIHDFWVYILCQSL